MQLPLTPRCGRWELCCHSDEMWEVGVLSPDVGGGSCAATPTRLEVGVSFPDVEGGSPVSRCGRWELCCHSSCGRWESSLQMWELGCLSDEVWEVGVALPLRRGWSYAASPTRLEVGVPQSNYKTTQHKLVFQSARFQERVLNFQLHNLSGPLRSLVAPSDTERTVNTRFIGTRGRSDTAG